MERDYAKIGCIIATMALAFSFIASYPVLYNFFTPTRVDLSILVGTVGFSFSDSTTASVTVPVTVTNYSPQTVHITDWSLALKYNGTSFRLPNLNCTHGPTVLDPAQQTEFVYSYDISNNTSISNTLTGGVFTISFIDNVALKQQQIEFFTRQQTIRLQASGVIQNSKSH